MRNNINWKQRISFATPFICLIIFLSIGYYRNIWSPTWVVFFAIPIVPAILDIDDMRIFYPITVLAAYLAIGFTTGFWHPTWIMFITIPVFYILVPKRAFKKSNTTRIE